MTELAARAREVLGAHVGAVAASDARAPSDAVAKSDARAPSDAVAPFDARAPFDAVAPFDARAPFEAPSAPRGPLTLTHEGEVWCLRWAGREVRVRDARGLHMLARLVAAPHERIHALVLVGSELVQGDAGDALDPTALRAYRRRLDELRGELDEAEARHDLGRVEQLRGEEEQLHGELSRAVGLGGRSRKLGSATERARVNVTRRIKGAIARVGEADAALGKHLEGAVRTGTFCCYLA